MYNWEASGKKQGKRAKKTGTVILHTDEQVDLTFERLCKEQYVQDVAKEASNTTTPEPQSVGDDIKLKVGKKAPLMTEATASSLERRMGFKELLPSQAQCYRGIFKGRDVILHSRTGSGKTLAYALPIIERHLILETSQARNGPFVIIFVFSDELAYQTRGVLQKIYKKLVIGVAGLDNISSQPHDIIIGTVGAVDIAVRGPRADAGRGRAVSKRLRSDDDDEDGLASEGDSDDDDEEIAMRTLVDVSGVRAIVVDEVDTTLGPRYSNTGRRMRNLLKVIRRANGALSESLLSDFRSHHYVLCGATIPNWVIKAGFLGEKKFYYQLISVGAEKLPPQLEVFATGCARNARVERASAILNEHNLGRVVVFGTPKEMSRLEDALTTHRKNVVRSLLPKHDEADRIKAMDDFNSKSTSNVLLCTDLAARGLDFTDVDTVLMLSLPSHNMAAEVFVHRAGRTARVGKPGRCVLLFDDRMDTPMLDAITKFTHVTFRKMALLEVTASNPHDKGTTPMTSFQLKVKNAFNGKEPSANPESILRHALGESSFEQVVGLTHPSGDTQIVQFEFPMELSHVVTAKLWKYDIREVKRQVV